jgi:hypothetical protein
MGTPTSFTLVQRAYKLLNQLIKRQQISYAKHSKMMNLMLVITMMRGILEQHIISENLP